MVKAAIAAVVATAAAAAQSKAVKGNGKLDREGKEGASGRERARKVSAFVRALVCV